MSEKFRNKYRIPSARASWWDYADPGVYFITICTHGMNCIFGKINDGNMNLSALGKIADEEWQKSFEIRAELFCDSFVIMPNHIHALLRIESTGDAVQTHGRASLPPPDADLHVQTHGRASQKSPDTNLSMQTHGRASLKSPDTNLSMQTHGRASLPKRSPKSISSFVAGFKSAATTRINQHRMTPKMPVWQTRFHDHIVRNDAEYLRISDYIAANPGKWKKDTFYSEGEKHE